MNAGPRCPAILLIGPPSGLRDASVRCTLIHHPESDKHTAGSKHWEAPLSEAERVVLLAETCPAREREERAARIEDLRADVIEACLLAAKECAEYAGLPGEGSRPRAESAKALVEAACLLRGT